MNQADHLREFGTLLRALHDLSGPMDRVGRHLLRVYLHELWTLVAREPHRLKEAKP